MGDMTKEPSMEEILSSIKRIIAEEGETAVQTAPRRGRSDAAARNAPVIAPGAVADEPAESVDKPAFVPSSFVPMVEEVLELTDQAEPEVAMPPASPKSAPAAAAPSDEKAESILSVESEVAARHSLSALSSMLIAPKDGGDNTLDGLVRAMLKPILKEWLDARLPQLVEEMVAKEIARITGR